MLALAGVVLLVLAGSAGSASWMANTLWWMLLTLAFFARVAEADGLALPRPGRVAVRTTGC
jgi:hypothetical protein